MPRARHGVQRQTLVRYGVQGRQIGLFEAVQSALARVQAFERRPTSQLTEFDLAAEEPVDDADGVVVAVASDVVGGCDGVVVDESVVYVVVVVGRRRRQRLPPQVVADGASFDRRLLFARGYCAHCLRLEDSLHPLEVSFDLRKIPTNETLLVLP